MRPDLIALLNDIKQLQQTDAHGEVVSRLEPSPEATREPALMGALAASLAKTGRLAEAGRLYERLGALAADKAEAFQALACQLYLQAGAGDDLARIAPVIAAMTAPEPSLVMALARTLQKRKLVDALPALLDRLDLSKPEQAFFKASSLKTLGQPEAARACLKQALAHSPNDVLLTVELMASARGMMDFDSMRAFDQLMAEPRTPFAHAVFTHQAALDRLYWLDDPLMQSQPSADELRLRQRAKASGEPAPRRAVSSDGKIRIGYLSNEFGNFIVFDVMEPIFLGHDRERFTVTLFGYGPRAAAEKRLGALSGDYIDLSGLDDRAAAARIDAEGIDILLDLNGFTGGARLNIARLSGAPVKAVYLGYPATTPGAAFDYAITDRIVTPDSAKAEYREKLCRLPETQMPNRAFDVAGIRAVSRADVGLPEDKVIVGAFNAPRKMTPKLFDLWMEILRAAPEAILWTICRNKEAQRALLAEAERLEVSADRIFLIGETAAHPVYLGQIALADLALDTMPYNGHSTSADILRAGTPLVTMRGQSYHSRVSWALLRLSGCEELAAETERDYVRLALELIGDADRRAGYRAKLEAGRLRSPLFQPDRMTRHLETAYAMMVERARQGLPPDHIDVPALPR
jgi:predicted O-linked N-acetylglucosamine transferase (SPINDLY family)